jgi:hypothetical protein
MIVRMSGQPATSASTTSIGARKLQAVIARCWASGRIPYFQLVRMLEKLSSAVLWPCKVAWTARTNWLENWL